MPISTNLIFNLEVIIYGSSATGGAGVKNAFNTFHYLRTTTIPAFTKSSFATAFALNVIVPMAAALNVRWSANYFTVRVLDDHLDNPQSFTSAAVGAIATDSLPLNSAVTVQLKTALRGRNYKGSKHFSPASEVDTTQDILTGAGLARWQAVRDACGASFVDGNTNNWFPAVYSPSLSTPTNMPVAIIVSNQVTQALLNLTMGTMRRRKSRTIT